MLIQLHKRSAFGKGEELLGWQAGHESSSKGCLGPNALQAFRPHENGFASHRRLVTKSLGSGGSGPAADLLAVRSAYSKLLALQLEASEHCDCSLYKAWSEALPHSPVHRIIV